MPTLAPAAEPHLRSILDQLQGVWMSVAGPREARLLIAGRRYAFEFVGGDLFMGTFELAPGEMDMRIEEGPPDHVGKIALCLCQLDGGVLRWCPGRPGSGRRHTAFPSVDDQRYLSFVFRHVRKRTARS